MGGVITDDGRNWLADHAAGQNTRNPIQAMAIGTGTTEPTYDGSTMQNEIYREDVVITKTDIGTYEYSITVSGGTEIEDGDDGDIDGGTSVTEFGLVTSSTSGAGTLVWHEVREPVNVSQGDKVEFIIDFSLNRN